MIIINIIKLKINKIENNFLKKSYYKDEIKKKYKNIIKLNKIK